MKVEFLLFSAFSFLNFTGKAEHSLSMVLLEEKQKKVKWLRLNDESFEWKGKMKMAEFAKNRLFTVLMDWLGENLNETERINWDSIFCLACDPLQGTTIVQLLRCLISKVSSCLNNSVNSFNYHLHFNHLKSVSW